jgi:hypothetical protein
MPGPSASPDPLAEAPTDLERALRDNAVVMDNMVEVVKNLLACHVDLLEVVDGIGEELATVTAEVAALKAESREGSVSTPARHAEESLRQAAALAQRAAAILERSQDGAAPARLRSVEG